MRAQQIADMLSDGESFESVGEFAATCCQSRSLHLKPWEICPADFLPDDLSDPRPQRGAQKAHALLEKMQRLKISKLHPDPVAAIEQAERATARR